MLRPSNGRVIRFSTMRWAAALFALTSVLRGAPPAVASSAAAPQDGETAFLDVASDPPAKIVIDDVDTAKVTPEPKLAVKPGHHKLPLITLDNARRRTLGFTVAAGETRKFTVHLAP